MKYMVLIAGAEDQRDGLAEQDRAEVYQRILGRPPGPREQDLARDFLQKQTKGYAALVVASFAGRSPAFADPRHLALTDLCLALLNSAEFSYVD